MGSDKVVKIHTAGAKAVPIKNIPAKDIRTARDALAEDIVIAEMGLADGAISSNTEVAKKIERVRGDIGSLKNIDTFLKEIGHE